MKIVINTCFGGFGLSEAAMRRFAELNGREVYAFEYNYNQKTFSPLTEKTWCIHYFDVPNPNDLTQEERNNHYIDRSYDRSDPKLVQVVEELGDAANGDYAELTIVEIPDGVKWTIEEYDGREHVAEEHRTWS